MLALLARLLGSFSGSKARPYPGCGTYAGDVVGEVVGESFGRTVSFQIARKFR